MQSFPDTPACEATVDLTGHLWIQELPTGGDLRFRLTDSGALEFGTRSETAASITALPASYRRGAQFVRDGIDRTALQAASTDPTSITFFGLATRYEGLDYDWQAVPVFLGVDVWSGRKNRYLPPDAATTVFERLGLPTLPAIAKEQPVAHTDLSQYSEGAIPPGSSWAEDPAAGILLRDKTGTRCEVWFDSTARTETAPEPATADELAAEYVTEARIRRTVERVQAAGQAPTVETIRERIVADVAREHYAELYRNDEPVVSMDAFASEIAERVQRHLAEKS